MSAETLFSLVNMAVLPGWLILIFAPRQWPVLNAIPRLVIPLGLSLVYVVLVLVHFSDAGGGYGSLADVRTLFASDLVLVAGWVHYLAFDLFVAGIAADRMDRAGIDRVHQGFILPVIFLFGPFGFVLAVLLERMGWPSRLSIRALQNVGA